MRALIILLVLTASLSAALALNEEIDITEVYKKARVAWVRDHRMRVVDEIHTRNYLVETTSDERLAHILEWEVNRESAGLDNANLTPYILNITNMTKWEWERLLKKSQGVEIEPEIPIRDRLNCIYQTTSGYAPIFVHEAWTHHVQERILAAILGRTKLFNLRC